MSEIRFPDIILDNSFIYKGAITGNNVAEELTSKEVKSGNNFKSVSLNMYINEYKPKYVIRFSTRNFGFEKNIKSIPLYATFCIK